MWVENAPFRTRAGCSALRLRVTHCVIWPHLGAEKAALQKPEFNHAQDVAGIAGP